MRKVLRHEELAAGAGYIKSGSALYTGRFFIMPFRLHPPPIELPAPHHKQQNKKAIAHSR